MIGFISRSIPRRILAALLSIYVATYFATAIVVYSGVRASLLESDATSLNQLADLKYEQLVNVIGALATDLRAWSELDVMNDLVSGDIDKRVAETLEALKRLYGLAGDIYAFDAAGKLLASSGAYPIDASRIGLPSQWKSDSPHLVFFDKETDPITRHQIIALAVPVFGTFDRSYRIGTLVMTYPWSSVENQLFGLEYGTLLLEKGEHARVLAANPADLASQTDFDPGRKQDRNLASRFVAGRSLPRSGLLANWQVVTLQASKAATRPLHWVALELALLGAVLGLPIVILGRWLSQRLTAPIADLTRVVREIADTDKLEARAPITSSDELGSLAHSFNRMTENLERTTREREQFLRELAALNQTLEAKIAARTTELEAAMTAQRRFIGDISHEIKSPLARLSMALGLARRSPESDRQRQFDRIEREVQNISALASELLTLARLDGSAVPSEFTTVDLADVVQEIVADARFEKPDRARDIVLRLERPALVLGDADLLRRAIENVVRNAIFYTAESTKVEISLSNKAPGLVALTVADHGPGVPEPALAHLFEPFYRVDEARARETGGTGIGLAICQRVVQLHDGNVRARNNDPHGLVVEFELPALHAAVPTTHR
ncbi:MAG TPA: ATP-binding protein [Stellaceae bacterium]|nr:ATP-binding protein [Stellaceae bacterium]